jgi:glycosyltransferase involved in cell wall biosynthesis
MRGPERILMTADAVGGVWTYGIALAREMAQRGVQTTLAVMGPSPSPSQRCEATAAGVDVVDRPYRLEWMDDPWDDVERAGEWLLEVEDRLDPDVIHLNGYAHAALPWRAPAVVVAHSCIRSWWRAVKKETPPAAIDRYTTAVAAGLSSADAIVAPSGAMGRALKIEYGIARPVSTIANGLPPTVAPARVAKEPMVLAAGRAWDPAKNIQAICDVAGALSWPVYVAGDCRAPAGTAVDLPPAHVLGQLPQSELQQWYHRASIYVLPARYEPFGLSVLEAARAGCALVLGDIDSLRENWEGAAVFVDPDDRDELSRAISHLIAAPGERLAFARRAQARATAFTISRTADSYLRAYAAL